VAAEVAVGAAAGSVKTGCGGGGALAVGPILGRSRIWGAEY
jgi:hypothetical protein